MKRRGVALIGALALMPIGWGLVQHTMSIPEAAKRALIVFVALSLVEMILLPLLGPMLQPAPEPAAGAAVDGAAHNINNNDKAGA